MAGSSGFPPDMPGLPVTDLQYTNARTYTSVVAALIALSSSIIAMRLTARWKSSGLDVDDYFIIGAAIFGLIDMAVVINSVSPLLGARPQFLPFSYINQASPLSLVAEVTSTWSVALLKTSIAFMLLRLQKVRGWTIFLYSIIGVQFVTALFVTIMQITRCIPINALWDTTITEARCWGQGAFKASMTTASVLVIITDVIFALIPLTFLHHIRRSLRDRLIIGFLMSLGLLASAASVVKTVMVQRFDEASDPSGHGMSITLWASIEAQVGIIAACIPCLRGAFLRFMGRVGILTQVPGSVGKETAKMSWQGAKGTSQLNARPMRLPSGDGAGNAFGNASRMVSTKIVANQSDEDMLVSEKKGDNLRHGVVQRRTEIEIELESMASVASI